MKDQFELPRRIEEALRSVGPDLDRAAKETLLVELYRQGKIAHAELADALELTRYQTDGLLKRHNVVEDLTTIAELEEELQALPPPPHSA